MQPFIQPYQVNFIRSQLNHLLKTVYFVGDYRVYEATKQSVREKIESQFPIQSAAVTELFESIATTRGKSEVEKFITSLTPYVMPFPEIRAEQLKKLFPKVKKLAVPDLENTDFSKLTYLGWRDVASRSIFIVYSVDGEMKGTECKYALGPTNRQSICSVCGGSLNGGEVGLVVAVTKSANYKSVGMHMCLNSMDCNTRVTQVDDLESLIRRWHSR